MEENLQQIIEKSTFTIQEGKYIYAKVDEAPAIDNHFMVTKDQDEITVVTREENLAGLKLVEKNKDYWSLIALNVSIPFYSVGFLATVSTAIAKNDMNVLIISTYSKDYIMVRHDLTARAVKALEELGFKETSADL